MVVNVVEAEHVTKSYQAHAVLNDVSFRIGEGEVFALLGPNGAGKTTLLRLLTGILLPDSGTFRLFGKTGASMDTVREKVGYLPEERGLYRRQKIGETLAYLAELKGIPRRDAPARARAALALVGMEAHVDNRPEALSKGMAQRIQIAAALVHDPPFVILDEPFSGLDPVSARQVRQIVLDEKARGRTFLLSTHQMEPVERLCDRLLMLHRGNVVLSGPVGEVRAAHAAGTLRVEHSEPSLPAALPLPAGARIQESREHVTIFAREPDCPPRAVIAALIAAGVDVTSFAHVQPTLEEIFVGIVGEKG